MRIVVCAVLAVFLVFLFLSCSSDNGDPVSSSGGAQFTIVSKKQGMTTYGAPKVTITVENIGSRTGYNVSCDVQAKQGDTIIDSGFAYFANGGDIDPGEKAQDDAIFFELTSLSGYQLEYDLDWLER